MYGFELKVFYIVEERDFGEVGRKMSTTFVLSFERSKNYCT